MPGTHALLSASGASRWIACPPSARLEETFPESESVYADEGTLAHHIGELMILKNLGRITHSKFTHDLLDYQKNDLYSSEMLDHAESYASFVMEEYNREPGNKIFPELTLDTTQWIKEGFGTADAPILRISRKTITVIDLKYGKGVPVKAERNAQGMVYLLGALSRFDWIFDFDLCEFIIFQPRLDSISRFEISRTDLLLWAERILKPQAELAYRGEGEFQVGDHCRFCRAKSTCRAFAEYNLEVAKYNFKPEPLLSDEEVVDVLSKADLIKNWIGAVEEYAQNEAIKNGKRWPGFKIVSGRSNRKYVSEDEVVKRLAEKGYAEEVIYLKKLRGITDLTKEMGKTDFESILADLIIKPPGAPTLVSVEDKRPEINSLEKAQSYFE